MATVFKIKPLLTTIPMAAAIKYSADIQNSSASKNESKFHEIPNFQEIKTPYSYFDAQEMMMAHREYKLNEQQFQSHQNKLHNENLKKISEKIYSKGLLKNYTANYISDIDAGIQNINDEKVKTHINKIIQEMDYIEIKEDNCIKSNYFKKLEHIGNIVDTYNELNGNYSVAINAEFIGYDVFYEFNHIVNFINNDAQKKYPAYTGWIKDSIPKYLSGKRVDNLPVMRDFMSLQKTSRLSAITNDNEISNYLYEKHYIDKQDIPEEHKQILRNINNQFNTKILLSADYSNRKRELTMIQKEFSLWQEKSQGAAKLPKILDLNIIKAEWDNAVGLLYFDNDIWLNGSGFYGYKSALRHELTHMNDKLKYKEGLSSSLKDKELANLLHYLMPSKTVVENGLKKKVLNFDKCPYREEFLNAGIRPGHIRYAYSNRKEFIAVAAEGDCRQYSPEFKDILKKLGMPEYVFDLPCNDADTISSARIMSIVNKKHPNEKDFNKLKELLYKERKIQEQKKLEARQNSK